MRLVYIARLSKAYQYIQPVRGAVSFEANNKFSVRDMPTTASLQNSLS